MRSRKLGSFGPSVSVLGLGCSHIASLSTRASSAEISRLLDQAYDGGIRFFDTADIYGQGDSERRLARIARLDGVVICTKGGLALKASQSLVRLAKPVLRPMLQRLKGANSIAVSVRQNTETNDLDPERLTRRLENSLRRLKRDQVDAFLLHSPPLEELADGRLYDLLDKFRDRGLAAATGVSCRSISDGSVVVSSGRAQLVQLPLNTRTLPVAQPVFADAEARGVGVIAREILPADLRTPTGLKTALRPMIDEPRIATALVGTTNATHLAGSLALANFEGDPV